MQSMLFDIFYLSNHTERLFGIIGKLIIEIMGLKPLPLGRNKLTLNFCIAALINSYSLLASSIFPII